MGVGAGGNDYDIIVLNLDPMSLILIPIVTMARQTSAPAFW